MSPIPTPGWRHGSARENEQFALRRSCCSKGGSGEGLRADGKMCDRVEGCLARPRSRGSPRAGSQTRRPLAGALE